LQDIHAATWVPPRGAGARDPLTPELLAELCHDLRGPLGAIGTWVPVLKSERADNATRERALLRIAGDVRVMGSFIDQLSALVEILSGSAEVSLVPIDVVPFVRSACADMAEKGAELPFREGEDSLMAVADPRRLRQILDLLGWNALTGSQGDSRALAVSRRDAMVELGFETTGAPRVISVTLVRLLAEVQGGALEETRGDGTAVLRVLLPLAP